AAPTDAQSHPNWARPPFGPFFRNAFAQTCVCHVVRARDFGFGPRAESSDQLGPSRRPSARVIGLPPGSVRLPAWVSGVPSRVVRLPARTLGLPSAGVLPAHAQGVQTPCPLGGRR